MSERAVWRKGRDERISGFADLNADRDLYFRGLERSMGCLPWALVAIGVATGYSDVAIGLIILTLFVPRLRKRTVDVTPMLTLPLVGPTFPCDIEVKEAGQLLGRDRGVVTFVEGWLHFEGRRTTFSLSRRDVRKRDRNELFFEQGAVAFLPDDKPSEFATRTTFATEIDQWYRIAPAAQGISILPPCEVHRSGWLRARIDLAGHALMGVAAMVASAALLANGSHWVYYLGFLFFALTALNSARQAWGVRRFMRRRAVGRSALEKSSL